MNWEGEGESGKAPPPPWVVETPYVHLDHGAMGTINFESNHEDTNEPCMNDKCNANSSNECRRPQNQICCGTPMESNWKATTNVSYNQRCAYLCFPWSNLFSPSEDTPSDW